MLDPVLLSTAVELRFRFDHTTPCAGSRGPLILPAALRVTLDYVRRRAPLTRGTTFYHLGPDFARYAKFYPPFNIRGLAVD